LRKDSIPIEYLKKKISSSIRNADRISAETITYSEFLSHEFGIKVEFVPYPPIDSRFNEKQVRIDDDLYVSLGSARKDKGFEVLPVWITQIAQVNPKAHFIIQKATKEWDGYNKTLEEISRLNNVRILPSYIDEKRQYEILAAANAFLAPYDQVIYQYRGSAFARRAMYLGKSICVTPGTSMFLDAERHNLLFSQDFIVNELVVSKDRSTFKAVGIILQDEAIKIWKNFLI
jgi:glycosyltransferase involved in cell wall biosynthesis